ncbi:hypothetical protein L6452_42122 [Arctium lappa]|uniref:Uncharacterized protein n=1 Tax=Arctium lappa TaxID=4217 RepID=A0ACB8XI24_ARCLA|nr:hypothetical protein L6452_42122 [Arctium lappa]
MKSWKERVNRETGILKSGTQYPKTRYSKPGLLKIRYSWSPVRGGSKIYKPGVSGLVWKLGYRSDYDKCGTMSVIARDKVSKDFNTFLESYGSNANSKGESSLLAQRSSRSMQKLLAVHNCNLSSQKKRLQSQSLLLLSNLSRTCLYAQKLMDRASVKLSRDALQS